MTHSTPDVLALLALGEEVDAADARHVPTCGQCRTELAELEHVVAVGRSTAADDVLVEPAGHVWDAIRAEVTAARSSAHPGPVLDPTPGAGAAGSGRSVGSGVRWTSLALAAALALVIGAGAGFGISRVLSPGTDPSRVVTLNALPRWPGAQGQAHIEQDGKTRTLVVAVELPATVSVDGQMEVWLSDTRAHDMVAMGLMPDGTGRFVLPPSMDLDAHPVVDVSLEPRNDPNPAHSDVSVVRGRLSV